MSEIVPTKNDNTEGMDFEQALADYGLQKSDFGTSLDNAAAKYRRECNKYWTENDETLAGSKRKVEAKDELDRPKRERNYLPEENARLVMKDIISTYGQRADSQQNDRKEALRREQDELAASEQRRQAAKERIAQEQKKRT
jgi:hypothetical protein